MKRLLATIALLLCWVAPAAANTRTCTSTMVSTLSLCRATTDVLFSLPISTVDPDNGGPRQAPSVILPDAIADNFGWSANMTCTQEMVDAAICTAPQIGTPVAVTKARFADMIFRRWVLEQVKQYRRRQEQATAQTTVDAEPAPDVGN